MNSLPACWHKYNQLFEWDSYEGTLSFEILILLRKIQESRWRSKWLWNLKSGNNLLNLIDFSSLFLLNLNDFSWLFKRQNIPKIPQFPSYYEIAYPPTLPLLPVSSKVIMNFAVEQNDVQKFKNAKNISIPIIFWYWIVIHRHLSPIRNLLWRVQMKKWERGMREVLQLCECKMYSVCY